MTKSSIKGFQGGFGRFLWGTGSANLAGAMTRYQGTMQAALQLASAVTQWCQIPWA